MTALLPATKPPVLASDFEKLPAIKSTRSVTPKHGRRRRVHPCPARPSRARRPTITIAWYCSARSHNFPQRRSVSPPLNKRRPRGSPWPVSGPGPPLARARASPYHCAPNRSILAPLNNAPSQSEEWMLGFHQQGIAALQQRTQAAHAREITRRGDVTRFLAEKCRQRLFEFDMIFAGAVRQSRSARTRAPFIRRPPLRCRHDLGMLAQAEIFVARHHHHGPALDGEVDALNRVHDVVVGVVFPGAGGWSYPRRTVR